MRVYHRQTQRYAGGAWGYPVPTATVIVRDAATNVIETIAATYDATLRRLYFDTSAAASYVIGQIYLASFAVTYLGVTRNPAPDPLIYCADTAGDAPEPPGIGMPVVTESTATFPHTAPTANYAYTVIFNIPWPLGGAIVTGQGSGATIEVTGLTPGLHYLAVAIAYGTGGAPSTIGANSMVPFGTLAASVPLHPLYVKIFVNDEDGQHEYSPETIDLDATPDHAGGSMSERCYEQGVSFRTLSILLEAAGPHPRLRLRGLGFVAHTRSGEPAGLGGPSRSR